MARDILVTYPDFNKQIKINTNASYFKLGAVIRQKGKPIALYSRKITDSQIGHTVTEKEMLRIV